MFIKDVNSKCGLNVNHVALCPKLHSSKGQSSPIIIVFPLRENPNRMGQNGKSVGDTCAFEMRIVHAYFARDTTRKSFEITCSAAFVGRQSTTIYFYPFINNFPANLNLDFGGLCSINVTSR